MMESVNKKNNGNALFNMVLGIKMRTDGYKWVRKTFLTVTI